MAAALVQERWAALERLRQAGGIGSDVELELKRLELHEEAGLLHSAEANRRRAQIEDGGVRLPLLLLLFIAFAGSLVRGFVSCWASLSLSLSLYLWNSRKQLNMCE